MTVKKEPIKRALNIAGFVFSLAGVLWVTLFSRLGNRHRKFFPLFFSYRAIASGSFVALADLVANILLFVPVGIFTSLAWRLDVKRTAVFGALLSLLIECSQWFFWLGSFDADDIIHNTAGALAGACLVHLMKPAGRPGLPEEKKDGLSGADGKSGR